VWVWLSCQRLPSAWSMHERVRFALRERADQTMPRRLRPMLHHPDRVVQDLDMLSRIERCRLAPCQRATRRG
jgi:hypothetical protein